MEKSIALFAIINFTIIGVSHIMQHQGWREFFALLHSHGRVGAFFNGFLALFVGSIVVSFHNVWSGPPTLLTLLGWAYLAKALSIFVYPDWNVRSMATVQKASVLKFRAAGFALLAVAAVLGFALASNAYAAN